MAFKGYLKQSTAATIKVGPFLDSTDGDTAETGLTISQADVRLSKNGGNMAQKNESSSATHDELGLYDVDIDTTDTATLGSLVVSVHESGALQVRQDYCVLAANVFDSLVGGGDFLQIDVEQVDGSTASGVSGAISSNITEVDGVTVADIDDFKADVSTIETAVAAKYYADISLNEASSGATDQYTVSWFKDGAPVTSGITSPTVQVIQRSNGADLVASTAMTQIGSTGVYKYDETTNTRTDGVGYIVVAGATIDSGARTWRRIVSRDA